jgi:hypothetical protein
MDQPQFLKPSNDLDIKALNTLKIQLRGTIPAISNFDLEAFLRCFARKIAACSPSEERQSVEIERRIQEVLPLLQLHRLCNCSTYIVRDRPKILSCPHKSSNCTCYKTEGNSFQGWHCTVPCVQVNYFGECPEFEAEHQEIVTTAQHAKERLELYLAAKYPKSTLAKLLFRRLSQKTVDRSYKEGKDFIARALQNYGKKMSSSSGTPESWISSFCSLLGHEYFAEISEDFIEDDFNLTGLQTQVAMYKEALEVRLSNYGAVGLN